MIDFKNEQEVKDFILSVLIKKERLLDQVEELNESVEEKKEIRRLWMDRCLKAEREKTLLKEELEQIKSNATQAQEGEEGHEGESHV